MYVGVMSRLCVRVTLLGKEWVVVKPEFAAIQSSECGSGTSGPWEHGRIREEVKRLTEAEGRDKRAQGHA
jgi:hypothetical protein